jgi:parallel beta-helix repeat protein
MVILVVGVLVLAIPSHATIINVPGDQPTIQAGIDASVDSDTVLVQPGTYVENINFNGHNIILGSLFLTTGDNSYISTTVIAANEYGSVVTFENGEDGSTIISGFTLQNGLGEFGGGGIYCYESNAQISNNIIIGNSTGMWGGGIYCLSSDPTISYNIISGNSTFMDGGGIYCHDSDPVIFRNTISGNSTYEGVGGGICCRYNSNPDIYGNTISGNSTAYGGGIFCSESSPGMTNNTITLNSAWSSGGGIYCELVSNPVITNTIFWANSADTWPEIRIVGESSPIITYCDVQGGWAGEGNIDCDPMFCDPENGNFYLDPASCCVGAGEGGVDIGAFGVDCGEEIPTLSEWGMLIMGLLLLALGTVAVIRRRKEAFANEH